MWSWPVPGGAGPSTQFHRVHPVRRCSRAVYYHPARAAPIHIGLAGTFAETPEAHRRGASVEVPLPVGWYSTGRSGSWLLEWVVQRRGQLRPIEGTLALVVPEPVFTWLEAANGRVSRAAGMVAGVPTWRAVATTNVTAFGASPKV